MSSSAYLTLQRAVREVHDGGHLRPEHTAFVIRVMTAPLAAWTPDGAVKVRELLTRHYAQPLTANGWDLTALPAPEPVPAAVPATVSTDGASVLIAAPPQHPLHDTIRAVPGITWDGTVPAYRLTPTASSAAALRTALTGHAVTLSDAAKETLRAALATPEGPNITVTADGAIAVRFEHTKERQDDVKRLCGATWSGPEGMWLTTSRYASAVQRLADQHGLTTSTEFDALVTATNAPFTYDGTIDGLRGVPVTELEHVRASVGTKRTKPLAERLSKFGIESIYDLLSTIPHRYLDRSTSAKIREIPIGETRGFLARIRKIDPYDKTKKLVRVTVSDGSGEVSITFFRSPYIAYKFRVGDEVTVYGRMDVYDGRGKRIRQMTNPVMDRVGSESANIVPVYPQSEEASVSTWDLHVSAMEAVRRLGDLADPLPSDILIRRGLIPRGEAFRHVHAPASVEVAEQARHRLAYDELFRMQLALGMQRAAHRSEAGIVHNPDGSLTEQYIASLPFPLTGAQRRVRTEIEADLRRAHPMARLLQGDVGAGKSACAAMTLLAGIEGGYQGALMAPTEILATQLFSDFAARFADLTHPDGRPVVVEFLGGKTRVAQRRKVLAGLADGSVDVLVGTHALLSDDVEFANLGIVVIDEQHRFGVEQRAALRGKGTGGAPDLLIMTATPIPRTQALTAFGDLATSLLDELPPGRTPIVTRWLSHEPDMSDPNADPWMIVREQVGAGRQAYVVASLVEDNENLAAKSAQDALDSLTHGALFGLRLGMVHGKQKREEREEIMAAFKDGQIDVLVSTTVIEVGVNVPNATVMVILDATRFGLAQLHQLRGRVGRGQHASECILTGDAKSNDAVTRMQALCESTDGFYLSEVDLNLRGTGSIFGARQSGQSDLRVADLLRDGDLIREAREDVDLLMDGDERLARRPGLRHEVDSALSPDAREWLSRT